MTEDNVRATVGIAGDVTRENYGQEPDRDVTHVAIPFAIIGRTAEEAEANAVNAGRIVTGVVDRLPYVRRVTTHQEAVYALMASLWTALQQLDDRDRALVFDASPVAGELATTLALLKVRRRA